jgi:TatD DNase family protein
MEFIDTHTHLYLDNFKEDRDEIIELALAKGVKKFLLPNIDEESYPQMMDLTVKFPENIFPMIGIHPSSVDENYQNLLDKYKELLESGKFIAVGEIGIDLYWEKKFKEQQMDAFKQQLQWSLDFDMAVSIHTRDSFEVVKEVIDSFGNQKFKGIFHCFTGTKNQADWMISKGFLLGIGGIVTFKNSGLDKTLEQIELKNLVLETDSPFLTPSPYRGKRNNSSYIPLIAEKIAEIYSVSIEDVANITTENAKTVFGLR